MLVFLLLLFFYVLSVLLISTILRYKKITLTAREITLAFGFKVLMGCLYGYIFQRYYGGDDTWLLHQGALKEYYKLVNDPLQFFADLDVTASFRRNEGFAAGWYFLLADLEYWIITKPLAVFNIISRGHYYVNVVFFNLLTFWGQYLLFKTFVLRFPQKRRLLLLLIFLLPSASFWLSGLRPDAWIMVAMGLVLYYFQAWLMSRAVKHLLLAMAGLLGLVIFRSPVLLILLPGLLAWFISERSKGAAWKVFTAVYACSLVIFFASAFISPRTNMLTYVVHRQQEFLGLQGNTRYQLNTLEPNAASFIKTLPQAFANTFLRPFPLEAKGALQIMTAIETALSWMVILFAFIKGRNAGWAGHSLIWLSLFFGVFLYLFIGFTVPFPGAIARYKVIPGLLLLLAVSMRLKTDIKK